MGGGIKNLVLVWLMSGVCFMLPAQTFISPDRLLIADGIKNKATATDTYFADLLAARVRWPWVDKFELRTEADRLKTNRQEFLFRTSFLGFSRRKFEFLRLRALAETKVADYTRETYKDFFTRCLFVVSMIKNQAEKDLAVTRVLYHRALDSLYRTQLAAGGDPDLRDFLKNREEWLEAQKKAEERRIFHTVMLEKEGYDSLTYLDQQGIISPENIIRIVENLSVDEKTHPDLAEKESQKRFLNSELDAEKAEDRKILDFAQVRYTTREDLLFENRFSVGVGLNIPWSGATRIRHQDIRIRLEENQFEKSNRLFSLTRQLEDKKAEAKALFEMYNLYTRQDNDVEWQTTRKRIEESGRVNPTDVFRLKIYALDRMEKISDIFHNLLQIYTEALYFAGKLDPETAIFERSE